MRTSPRSDRAGRRAGRAAPVQDERGDADGERHADEGGERDRRRRPSSARRATAPSSTTPSAGRRPSTGTRGEQRGADPHAGDRADEDRPHQAEVDVAAGAVGDAGGPQQHRGVEDVGADDARAASGWKSRMSARPMSAPLPTEVRPRMKPSTRPIADRPRPCARRSSVGRRRARVRRRARA